MQLIQHVATTAGFNIYA